MAIKCPFCHTNNEDGALFCDLCKSDLSNVAPTAAAPPAMPMAEAVPMAAEAMPMVSEAVPMAAEAVPMAAEAMPMATEAVPMAAEAMPMPPEPVHAEALHVEPPPAIAEAMPAAHPVHMPEPPADAHAPPPAPAPAAAAPSAAPTPSAPPAAGGALPAGAEPKLVVQRGQKRNAEYPIYAGLNFIGRADEKPVDIDLEDQEPPDRVWCSRQHACIKFENEMLSLEDLNSANGTYLNRGRVYPGQPQPLKPNDVIQIGNVQLKVVV